MTLASYPGSTIEQELKSYGVDGARCVLVSGPFANLSEDFHHVVDLIAHEKAAAWLEKRKMNPCKDTERALFRQGLAQCLGLLVMPGWSQLIIERFRDAVTKQPPHFDSSETPGFGADSVDFRATLAATATAARACPAPRWRCATRFCSAPRYRLMH